MITITRENIDEMKNIYFHDAEVKEVVSDYYNHTVVMPLKLYKKGGGYINALITFENVMSLGISFMEPWGAGVYVLGVSAEPIEITEFKSEKLNIRDCFQACFELNSGDEINVVAAKMVLVELSESEKENA